MAIITAAELVSYLREDGLVAADVQLVTDLANGLIEDEFEGAPPIEGEWPTWTRILALSLAEAGWVKFAEERVDDWQGKRSAALAAMTLSDADKSRIAVLDGRAGTATGYTVRMTSPLDVDEA